MLTKLKHKIFEKVLGDLLKGLDDSGGNVYVRQGRISKCKMCGKIIKLPPVIIPLRVQPKKGALADEHGHLYEQETICGHFHRACAIVHLLEKVDLNDFLPIRGEKPNPNGES